MKVVEFKPKPRCVNVTQEAERYWLRIKALLSSARRRKLKDEEVDELEAYMGLEGTWNGSDDA